MEVKNNNNIRFGESLLVRTKNQKVMHKLVESSGRKINDIRWEIFATPDKNGFYQAIATDGLEGNISDAFVKTRENAFSNDSKFVFFNGAYFDFLRSCKEDAQNSGKDLIISKVPEIIKLLKIKSINEIVEQNKK